MDRAPGLSVRVKLTLSYAALPHARRRPVCSARYGCSSCATFRRRDPHSSDGTHSLLAWPGSLLHVFAPSSGRLVFLLVFGLVGGWLLAGRMLAPLARITEATRTAATGSLSHRIRLPGRQDEFRELADSFDTMLARLEAHVAEQQRFAANASHELRTPLAITQTF